ncbi:MAG: prolyl oligopeptidase family serine peptidase [Labilithrix sp.]|nr:prolyl oligopeptidase family serine peptidase [Labilithrix sp.]
MKPAAPAKTRSRLRALALLAILFALLGYVALPHLRGRFRRALPIRVTTLDRPSSILPAGSAAPTPPMRTSRRSITAAGLDRSYVVVEPASLEPQKAYALVLVFHGDGGDGEGFHRAFPFERASGSEAILVYPDGIRRGWDLETLWGNREVELAVKIIDELASRLPIDRARLFATGYSSGGFLSNVIACHKPGLLRAFTSSAGGSPYSQALIWPNGYTKCPGQQPTAMMALHGEGDFAVPLQSGRWSATYWAYVNGCTADEMETTGYDECHAYRGCPADKAVVWCSVPGLGHWVWDRAAEASWTFFARQ